MCVCVHSMLTSSTLSATGLLWECLQCAQLSELDLEGCDITVLEKELQVHVHAQYHALIQASPDKFFCEKTGVGDFGTMRTCQRRLKLYEQYMILHVRSDCFFLILFPLLSYLSLSLSLSTLMLSSGAFPT